MNTNFQLIMMGSLATVGLIVLGKLSYEWYCAKYIKVKVSSKAAHQGLRKSFPAKHKLHTDFYKRYYDSKLVIVHVMAKSHAGFSGATLINLLQVLGLSYGPLNIFHYIQHEMNQERFIFSMARLTQPGSFDLQTIRQVSFKGISLFMPSEGQQSAINFEMMLRTAKKMALSLNAELRNEQQMLLDAQGIELLRENLTAHPNNYSKMCSE